MMQYLQAVVADVAQWPPVCWCAMAFCTFVVGVVVGGFMVDEGS